MIAFGCGACEGIASGARRCRVCAAQQSDQRRGHAKRNAGAWMMLIQCRLQLGDDRLSRRGVPAKERRQRARQPEFYLATGHCARVGGAPGDALGVIEPALQRLVAGVAQQHCADQGSSGSRVRARWHRALGAGEQFRERVHPVIQRGEVVKLRDDRVHHAAAALRHSARIPGTMKTVIGPGKQVPRRSGARVHTAGGMRAEQPRVGVDQIRRQQFQPAAKHLAAALDQHVVRFLGGDPRDVTPVAAFGKE